MQADEENDHDEGERLQPLSVFFPLRCFRFHHDGENQECYAYKHPKEQVFQAESYPESKTFCSTCISVLADL